MPKLNLSPDPQQAARQGLWFGFAALALPGLPLGALLAWVRPVVLPTGWHWGVLGLAALLSALALALAWWHLRPNDREETPLPRLALSSGLQAGGAPAIPFLLGCLFFRQPLVLLSVWGVAIGSLGLALWLLPQWVAQQKNSRN